MHIESCGKGPDLVLIHGWAMHSGIFAPLTQLLAKKFRVHCVDLPGHGYSRDSNKPLDIADCAHAIVDKIPAAAWVGWSLGGLISLHAAVRYFPHVKFIVQIATSPRFVIASDWLCGADSEVFRQFVADLKNDYHRTIDRFLALEAYGSDHAQAELRELKAHVFDRGEPSLQVLEEGLKILEQTDMRSYLGKLSTPSLWIAGRRDRLISPDAMRWAAAHSPQGKYLETSAGHAPFISHADEVATAISQFAENISQ